MIGPGIQQRDLRILRELALGSQVRGTDGSGIYQIKSTALNKWNNWEGFYKTYSTSSEMILEIESHRSAKTKGYQDLMNTVQADIYLGHTRSATRGFVNSENAHPYIMGNIVGAHNGTLRDKKYEHEKKTDSEMMFIDINQRGLKPVLEELNPDSAYAITMYDKRNRHMYFARNDKREFCFAVSHDRTVIYWASEREMLRWVLDRNDQKDKYDLLTLNPGVIIDIYAGDMTYSLVKNKESRKSMFKASLINTKKEEVKEEVNKGGDVWSNWLARKDEANKTLAIEDHSNVVSIKESKKDRRIRQAEERMSNGHKSLATSLKDFHVACSCGLETLTLLDQSLAERGKSSFHRKSTEGNTFYCKKCDPLGVKDVQAG